ncbi:DedA family protein [Pleurocapsa sp. PCC 7319]|uniref:DedA family protein n=1 Tax=Pleurocapsa sp. PCC 7319 TaxID=118161 RepID=UPI00034DD42A|nr:DedA family protein [Pleurocapsa sp. PCC 7319]
MLESIVNIINSLGYLGIALLMALENLVPPIPSEVIMPLSGFAVTQGKLQFIYVVLAGTIGSVLGATPWYFLGKSWGLRRTRKIADRYGKWLTLSGKDVQKAKIWFDGKGYIATAVGRLIPGIRTYISLPAGISKMPLLPFLIYSTAGSIIWVSFLTYAGYILGENYHKIGTYLKPFSTFILILILVISIYWIVKRKTTESNKR